MTDGKRFWLSGYTSSGGGAPLGNTGNVAYDGFGACTPLTPLTSSHMTSHESTRRVNASSSALGNDSSSWCCFSRDNARTPGDGDSDSVCIFVSAPIAG